MTCIKLDSDESHFNVSLIVRDKVTRQCPQTTTFEEKGEPKRYRTEVLPLTSIPNTQQLNTAVFCRLTLQSYYPCQLNHTLALKLNIVQTHQRGQEPTEKMPHTKKKTENMLHRNLRNARWQLSS